MRRSDALPSQEVVGYQAHSALAAFNSLAHVVQYELSRQKITFMVAHTVTIQLHPIKNAASMWNFVHGAAAEEHVVFHVFSFTFVAVKRMKLPSSEELDPQLVYQYYCY